GTLAVQAGGQGREDLGHIAHQIVIHLSIPIGKGLGLSPLPLFPRSTPCVKVSLYTAFHLRIEEGNLRFLGTWPPGDGQPIFLLDPPGTEIAVSSRSVDCGLFLQSRYRTFLGRDRALTSPNPLRQYAL
ncbi:hypothetical protein TR75_00330, partial [Hydrogenibacillus schlegelii]